MTHLKFFSVTALSLSLTASTAALVSAQESQNDEQQSATAQQQSGGDATWVDIATWNDADVYDGWSADALLGEDAYNQDGEEVGEVEDFIVGPDGMIQRVVVEGGGFLDIGDAHIAVPWQEARINRGSSVTLPFSGDDLDDIAGYPNMDDMTAMAENFRVREIIGDYAAADGVAYGTVDDVIFDQSGMIQALIVYPNPGYGYRTTPVALPYYGDGYAGGTGYYDVPYGSAQLDELRPFNYGDFR